MIFIQTTAFLVVLYICFDIIDLVVDEDPLFFLGLEKSLILLFWLFIFTAIFAQLIGNIQI